MHKDLDRIKNNLVYMQIFFLGILVLGFAFFLTHLSVKQKQEARKGEIEEMAHYLKDELVREVSQTQKMADSKEVSISTIEGDLTEEEYLLITNNGKVAEGFSKESGLDHFYENFAKWIVDQKQYRIFVLNKDGEMLLYPKKKDAELIVWQQHQAKIMYEIRKQEQGWLEYPKSDQRRWDHESNLIRYVHIPHLDWTLAVEGRMKSYRSYLGKSLDQTAYFYIAGVLLIGFIFMRLMTQMMFVRAEKIFGYIWQKRFVNLNTKDVQRQEKDWEKIRPQIQLPEPVRYESRPAADANQETSVHSVSHKNSEALSKMDALDESQEKSASKEASEVTKKEVTGIRLPLLKKILSEMKNI